MKLVYQYLILLAAPSILTLGCEQALEDPYTTYLLPEGSHGETWRLETLQADYARFEIVFDESAQYTTVDPVNQHDINKLVGFSDCNSQHHVNSARFGWRWLDGQLEIHAYTYMDEVRMSEYIGTVTLNESHQYRLSMTDDTYVFQLDDLPVVEMPRSKPCDKGIYYMMWPYFGGDEVAPHDIEIKILRKW